MNVSESLVEHLIESGVSRVYGVAGTSVLPFLNSLREAESEIRYIPVRHEQTAVSMADAEGRITGKPGVALVHAGAGFSNSVISTSISYKDCSPMIVISGGVKIKLKDLNGMLNLNQKKMIEPVVKEYFKIEDGSISEVWNDAYNNSVSECKGPVMIEVPEDVWEEETEDEVSFKEDTEIPSPKGNKLDRAMNLISETSNPVILAGGGIAYSSASDLLFNYAEKNKIPVITTPNGRGSIPETHPLSFGVAGFGAGSIPADYAFKEADLVICLGCSISDITSYEYTWKPKGKTITVNLDKPSCERHEKIDYKVKIHGNVKKALESFKKLNPKKKTRNARKAWLDQLEEKRKSWEEKLETCVDPEKEPLSPAFFMKKLSNYVGERDFLTAGAGMHRVYAYHYLKIERPRKFMVSANFGAMGFALPAALAAKAIHPERRAICVAGDGEIMMTIQELETAEREDLGVKIFVINDNSFGVLSNEQKVSGEETYGTEHGNPDFVKLAESFGIEGKKIKRPEEIRVLDEVLPHDDPSLVEVVVDPDEIPPTNVDAVLNMESIG